MIALAEISSLADSTAGGHSVRHVAEIARLTGTRVYRVPVDFDLVGGFEAAFWQIPYYEQPMLAVWVGFMLAPEKYKQIYEGLRNARNIWLLNSPVEHLMAEEFDRFYPIIKDLTPKSIILHSLDEYEIACEQLQFPMFIKGTVQSLKIEGPKSCIAYDADGLRRIIERLIQHSNRTRGRVIVRQYHELRSDNFTEIGMPAGREFRVFLFQGIVLALGYYWAQNSNLSCLDFDEYELVIELAKEVANRIAVPYIAVDVGQLKSGQWIIIEIGDAQFAGLCQIPPFQLWNRLSDAVESFERQKIEQK